MISTDRIRYQHQSILWHFFLFCCIQTILFGYMANLLFAAQITGTVYLPGTQTAPAGGIRCNIFLTDQTGHNDKVLSPVTILEGQSSQQYSATLPNDQTASWVVSYYYWGQNFVQHGYYSSSGTTWKYSKAAGLPGGQTQSGVDLTLLSGKTISGNISLPSGRNSPAGGIGFYVNAENIDHIYGTTRVSCFLPEGQTSSSYHLTLPNDTVLRFTFFYSYYGTDYVDRGYYSISGTQKKSDDATILSGGQDYSNINITVLSKFSWPMFIPAITSMNN